MNAVHQLPDLLQGGWWFGPGHTAATAVASTPHLAREPPSSWWWPFGSSNSQPRALTPAQRPQNGAKPRIRRPHSTSNLDEAGKPRPRPTRVRSATKLQPGGAAGWTQQSISANEGLVAEPSAQDLGGAAATAAALTKPLGSRQLKPEGLPKASSKPSGASKQAVSKQLSYQERRRLWRERLEHAKVKAERRAATSAAIAAAAGEAGLQAGLGAGGRKFASRHIAIPASKLGVGSSQSTPTGSPGRRPGPLGSEYSSEGSQHQQGARAGSAQGGGSPPPEFLDIPPIWQGYHTAEAPADFSACSEEELLLFLAQAGRPAPAPGQLPADAGALASAARECRNAWEVERIMVACQWPQEVLRVARHAEPAALKAAYRRVSMAVHPDKNMAAGASDAMSIVADAYNMLALAGGRTAATIPAFMRQNHRQGSAQQGAAEAVPPAPAGPPCPGPARPLQQEQPLTEQEAAAAAAAGPGTPGLAAEGGRDAEGALGGMSHVSSFEYAQEYLGGHPQPPRSCSGEGQPAGPQAEAGPSLRHVAPEPLEHWNPHAHLSSTEELSPQPPATASAGEGGPGAGGAAAAGSAAAAAPGLAGCPAAPPSHSNGFTEATRGPVGGAAPTQSPVCAPGSATSSRTSTPDRPASSTPSHSRRSSAYSVSGFEPSGPGPAPAPSKQGAGSTDSSAGAAAGVAKAAAVPLSRLPLAQKIVVRVKYKAAAGTPGK